MKTRWPQLEERLNSWEHKERSAGVLTVCVRFSYCSTSISRCWKQLEHLQWTVTLRLHAPVVAKDLDINDSSGLFGVAAPCNATSSLSLCLYCMRLRCATRRCALCCRMQPFLTILV